MSAILYFAIVALACFDSAIAKEKETPLEVEAWKCASCGKGGKGSWPHQCCNNPHVTHTYRKAIAVKIGDKQQQTQVGQSEKDTRVEAVSVDTKQFFEPIKADKPSPREEFASGVVDEILDKAIPSIGGVSPSNIKNVLESKDSKDVVGVVAGAVVSKVLERVIPGINIAILALTPNETVSSDTYENWYQSQRMKESKPTRDQN